MSIHLDIRHFDFYNEVMLYFNYISQIKCLHFMYNKEEGIKHQNILQLHFLNRKLRF